MSFPKIKYPTGADSPTTLSFVYPPRMVPHAALQTVRHDNIASSGQAERIFEQTADFLVFTMEYVKLGSDVSAWDTFMRQALQGISFDYFPDAAVNSFTSYELEDTNWVPAFKSLGMFSFSVKARKVVA